MLAEIFSDRDTYTSDEEFTFNELVTLYEGKIERERLTRTLKQYLIKFKGNPYLNYLQGHLLYDEGSYEKALYHFDYFINKGFYQGYYHKALCYQQLKQYSKALQLYNEALKRIDYFEKKEHPFIIFRSWMFPSRAQILNNKAAVNYNLQDYREAIENCTIAIKLEPKYSNPYFMRGCIYNSIEKIDAAFEDFRDAKMLNHNNSSIDRYLSFAEENGNNFFLTVKKIARDTLNSKDTDIQIFAFEHDLHEPFINHSEQISHLSSERRYDATLALAVIYIVAVWKQMTNAQKNDVVLGVMCYNAAIVFSKFYPFLSQYELFVDLTLHSDREIKKNQTT